jgi:hypothetical protein
MHERCCAFLTHMPSFLPFFRTSTGRKPEPMMMVDGSNDASLLKEVSFWYQNN